MKWKRSHDSFSEKNNCEYKISRWRSRNGCNLLMVFGGWKMHSLCLTVEKWWVCLYMWKRSTCRDVCACMSIYTRLAVYTRLDFSVYITLQLFQIAVRHREIENYSMCLPGTEWSRCLSVWGIIGIVMNYW